MIMAEYFQDRTDSKPMITPLTQTCPLCGIKKKRFTCTSCVQSGDFRHSNERCLERYAEKFRKFEILKRLKNEYEKRALDVIRKQENTEKLNCELISCRQKVLLLKLVVKEATLDTESASQTLKELREWNDKTQMRQMEHSEQLRRKAKQLLQFQAEKNDPHRFTTATKEIGEKKLEEIAFESIPLSRGSVELLSGLFFLQNITSLSLLDIQCDIESENNDGNRESELAEATRTSYIEGRWVSEEEDVRVVYSINGACLPGNGDYSSYYEWVKARRNGSRELASDEEISLKTPAFRMTAALTHACQMLKLMAFYLDVILPKRISYSEFCQRELSKKDFKSAVDRLNTNVLHLCFTQVRAKPSMISVANIWGGPFECHPELIPISSEKDDSDSSDQNYSASEDANSESDAEWENLPANLVHTTDSSTHQGTMSQSKSSEGSQKTDEPATAASLVSSAAASVAALWPWKK
ncbi:beclin 1-associated autophagy-related key regulator-like [Stylophora pistillata]|uniref:beclin 1-associated autophagy-related key regulator-like n=1 Tax=Stylophora pistillata TaxID=50429 RepID=UPI000C050463|nr:beclin 1-associated autophagy-related key regulator-like [Stylophora pistillata]